MNFWDILALLTYFIFVISVGYFARKHAKTKEGYFLAGRTAPWYLAGISMVATTYASDTPLAITGIIAKQGLSGNWIWWCSAFTYVALAVFFAKLWRKSGVITDAELTTLRYGNSKTAKILRVIKALYLGVLLNSIVLGWVFLAMTKILKVMIPWQDIAKNPFISGIIKSIPDSLTIGSPENTLTIITILIVSLVYTLMGGLKAVIITDLFQFFLALTVAYVIAIKAVAEAGGIKSILTELQGSEIRYTSPLPGEGGLPLTDFLICIFILWWAQYFSDGTGYLAQRVNSTRSEKDSSLAVLLFTFLNYWVRMIPWFLTALACLVIFPPHNPAARFQEGVLAINDREITYPLVIKVVAGEGFLGVALASFIAAFMSTVDTHLNWGTSYIINDVIDPKNKIPQKKLMMISRITTVLLAVLAVVVSTQIHSIVSAWILFFVFGAGLGFPQILRWFWWRVNPITEISSIITAFIIGVASLIAGLDELSALAITGISTLVVSITSTLMTKPVPYETLKKFCEKVEPIGFWPQNLPHKPFSPKHLIMWFVLSSVVISGMILIIAGIIKLLV